MHLINRAQLDVILAGNRSMELQSFRTDRVISMMSILSDSVNNMRFPRVPFCGKSFRLCMRVQMLSAFDKTYQLHVVLSDTTRPFRYILQIVASFMACLVSLLYNNIELGSILCVCI